MEIVYFKVIRKKNFTLKRKFPVLTKFYYGGRDPQRHMFLGPMEAIPSSVCAPSWLGALYQETMACGPISLLPVFVSRCCPRLLLHHKSNEEAVTETLHKAENIYYLALCRKKRPHPTLGPSVDDTIRKQRPSTKNLHMPCGHAHKSGDPGHIIKISHSQFSHP